MFNWFKRKWSEFIALFVQDAPEPETVQLLEPVVEVEEAPKGCQKCPTALECATVRKYDRIEPPVTVARRRPDTTITASRVSSNTSRDSYRSRRDDDTMLDITSPVSPFYMLQAEEQDRYVAPVHVYHEPVHHAPVHHTYEAPTHQTHTYEAPTHTHTYEAPSYTPSYTPSYESPSSDTYTSSSCDSFSCD